MTAVRQYADKSCSWAGRVVLIGLFAFLPLLPGQALAQLDLRTYSASGSHQCSGGQPTTCVVTGSFYRDCINASSALSVQDCCRTRRDGSHSTGFTLNYCIPQSPGPGRY